MDTTIRRIFVEKKPSYDIEAKNRLYDIRKNLRIDELEDLRIINRYDISGISEEIYERSKKNIFSEPPIDFVYDEGIALDSNEIMFIVEYLPGQYDQRADSCSQCIQILTMGEKPEVAFAKVYVLKGNLNKDQIDGIKKYCINLVDSREASKEKPITLVKELNVPQNVELLNDFIHKSEDELKEFLNENGLAMSFEDLKFCQKYFNDTENRNPTITEIKVIDTYWSDHCRHTTFNTELRNIFIEDGIYTQPIKETYNEYLKIKENVYKAEKRVTSLMDIAVIGMKELKRNGKLKDLDESEEINACSIKIDVDVDGKIEKWLLMFKNETHNHPTEIEPYGGAATCIGGAIRDPLSGRTYVYQAMRVTGSGDPRISVEKTLKGKLPQKKITVGAAEGYSSYGNQIGLATGHVCELYHEGYIAKRMEVGAVIAAAPASNVVRKRPECGDVVILLGGRTGRDGCGGATGSSKEHTTSSISTCGAEVQKGNAPTERKLQRLFRKPEVSTLIKRCNDFGAGGVAVAVGELTDGIDINLDLVPKKYEGLDGTELAISESQERMAVVVDKKNMEIFIEEAEKENLEAVKIAEVINDKRLIMRWNNKIIVNISREFLDTNGVRQVSDVYVKQPSEKNNYFKKNVEVSANNIKEKWLSKMAELNVCSQKGLIERFDSTIGANTVLMPFGGKYQLTPSEVMAAKIPVLNGETGTASLMSFGCNPYISEWSPYHGALYSVIESVAKIVAAGGDYKNIRLTFQEYFERLGKDKERWGKPFAALLGALRAQKELEIPAIGGKDSMSGTFEDITVPPTLVAFAVDVAQVDNIISSEFKKAGSKVILVPIEKDEHDLPVFDKLKEKYSKINKLIKANMVLASYSVKGGGIVEAISKMSFGNKIGLKFDDNMQLNNLFYPMYGSIILELDNNNFNEDMINELDYIILGKTIEDQHYRIQDIIISIDEVLENWTKTLEDIFPTKIEICKDKIPSSLTNIDKTKKSLLVKVPKPKVFIPAFPGTNCEYDSARAFEKAGGDVNIQVFKNIKPHHVEEAIENIVYNIENSQIIMIPGGFSAGDEPDGSGKFISTVFRNNRVKNSVMDLLYKRDGLMLGICNGFQALIKLGLVPFGEIRDMDENSPTLTYNNIGRHVSCVVRTKIVSNISPWFNNTKVGEVHSIPVSHGEGRFVASNEMLNILLKNGQIATQYVDFDGNPSYDINFNPNGSYYAIEGITSPDGRILGKMGHSERVGAKLAININGEKDQKLFSAGIEYYK